MAPAEHDDDPLAQLLQDADAARVEARQVLAEGEESQVIRFTAGGREFALPIGWVERTERLPSITPVPRAPRFIRGLASMRGGVVCILDVPALLGVEAPTGADRSASLLLVGRAGRRVGILSDTLPDFERVEPDEALRVPKADADVYTAALERPGGLVGILDPEKLLDLVEQRLSDAS